MNQFRFAFPIIIALLLFGCDKNEKDLKEKWTTESIGASTGELLVYKDSLLTKWKIVFVNDSHDTTELGPFKGHPPFGKQREFFEAGEVVGEEDRWVFEYTTRLGCTVKIIGIVNGKLTELGEYVVGGNCREAKIDLEDSLKSIYSSSLGNDSMSVLRINFVTGDSIYFATTPVAASGAADIEFINGKTIVVTEANDSTYVDVYLNGRKENSYKMPGSFRDAKDDGAKAKVIVSTKGGRSTALSLNFSGPVVTSSLNSFSGDLVDFQKHLIEGKTIFVTTAYDQLANVTHITFLDENGLLLNRHDMRGKFASAKSNGSKKAFATVDISQPPGLPHTLVNICEISTGAQLNTSPRTVGGILRRADDMSIDAAGTVNVKTTDGNFIIRVTN